MSSNPFEGGHRFAGRPAAENGKVKHRWTFPNVHRWFIELTSERATFSADSRS